MFLKLADFVFARRGLVAVLLLVVFVGVTAGASRLSVDFRVTSFFGGDDPEREYFEEFREYWGPDDDVLLVLVSAQEGDLLTPIRMRRLQEVSNTLLQHKLVRRVDSIATAPRFSSQGGVIDLEPLIGSMPPGQEGFQAWRTEVLNHAFAVPTLLSAQADYGAMLVETTASSDDISAVRPLVADLRKILQGETGKEGLSFTAAGVPAVRADFYQRFMADQSKFVPGGLLLIVFWLLVLFRKVHGVLVPALAAIVPAAMVFGTLGWAGEPIGVLNQAYTTFLPVIAVADAIHLVSRFHEEARRIAAPGQPLTREQRRLAIRRALGAIGAACFLTSFTTAVGFFSLMMAQMPVLRSFGLYAAVGIVFAYGSVILIIPLLLSLTRGSIPNAGQSEGSSKTDRALLAVARFSVNRAWSVIGVTVIVIGLCLYFGRMVVVDNHLTAMLSQSHPTSVANRTIDSELGGILGLELDFKGSPGAMKDPRILQAMLELSNWSRAQPEVRAVNGPADYIASVHEVMYGRRTIPDSSAAIAQIYLLGEGEGEAERIVAPDYSRARMRLNTRDQGGLAFAAFGARVQAQVDAQFEGLSVKPHITGTPFVAYRGINNVTYDLRDSLILAFLIITLVIGFLFREPRIALICLVPNALPLLVGYGFLGAAGWMLDPSPAIVFTVALGIAVDDTLHLMVRTREELRAGRELRAAIVQAVLHAGRAVTITSVVLVCGFGINAFSSFRATRVLGGLGAVVIFSALLCDLFVLPALLATFGRAGRWGSRAS